MPMPASASANRIPVWLIGFIIAMTLSLAAIAYYFLKPLDGPVPDDAGTAYAALEQGTTSEGFPRLGRADAPILVEEFSSYACSHCREFHDTWMPTLLRSIEAGQVQFVLIPVSTIGSGGDNAARAALCAGEQDHFWTMHDTLYSWQKKYLVRTFDPKRLKKGAENLGLDIAAFEECLDAARTKAQTELALQLFHERDLSGTPSLFINGQQVFDYREFNSLGSMPGATTEGAQ